MLLLDMVGGVSARRLSTSVFFPLKVYEIAGTR